MSLSKTINPVFSSRVLTMSNASHKEIDAAIAAFEAISPSQPGTLKLAQEKLRAIFGNIDTQLSVFLQRNFALFLDIDINNPAPKLGVSEKEIDKIVEAFWGPSAPGVEQPDIDLDNLASASAEDISGAQRFGLFMLFCLKLMVTIGVAGGSWYNTRKLSDRSVFTAEGQGVAIASGAVGAAYQAVMDEAFNQFTGWLNMSPAFEGENISAIFDMTKTFVTGLLGATTWFGVLQILDMVENKTPYQLFGLFALAFFFVGAINAGGEMAVGRQLAPARITGDEWQAMRPLLQRLFYRLTDKKTAGQLLISFLAWYTYWDYSEGFLQLARTKSHEQLILWGSLCIFFQFAAFGAFGVDKVFGQRSVTAIGGA